MASTFDVFFSYHTVDHATVMQVAQRLHDRGIRVFLDRWYLTAGQPWPSELERMLASCGAAAVFLGAEGLGPWQQRERDLALDRQAREPGFPVIPVLLSRTDPPLGFLKLNTWVDLSAGAADEAALAILTAAIRRQPPGPMALQQITAVLAEVCPYRDLRPFREGDEPFFFGRAAFIETLAAMIGRHPFIAVVGASGSGKSSVVSAGLIPRLRRREVGWIWEAVRFVPTDQPLHSLAKSLLMLLEPDLTEVDRLAEVRKLARHLAEGEVRLRDVTSRILEKQPGTERLLLFADQWEELYTLCTDEAIRTAFLSQLLEVVRSSAVTVVLTLRGDFMGHALANRELSDRLQDGIVTLGPMTRNELAETITKPAEKVGLAFEPGLVETILDDVGAPLCVGEGQEGLKTGGHEPGNLPLLEFLLEALWKERRGALLHYDAYHRLGRVSGAIAHRAEEVFERGLTEAEREAAPRLLIRMVRPGEGVEDTRQRAAMPEADPVALTTIRKLADARLVVTELDAASGRETVEVAHEALIRGWQRLRGWVDRDREFLRTRDRIAAQVQLWKGKGKPPDRLLPPGRPLAEGVDLLATRRADLDADLITYVEVSATAAKAEDDAKRAVELKRLRRARLVDAAVVSLIVLTTIGAVTITWWQGVRSPVLSAQRARLAQASDLDRVFTATALATLLKHQYGDSVSEMDLIKVLFNSRKYIEDPRHDFSLLDLTEYVASRGYRGIGRTKLTFADLVEKTPLIVPVRTNGFDHLAVVLGVIQNRVLLADPLLGNHIMLRDSFEGRWLDYDEKTGFVLWSRGHENIGFNVGPRDLKGPHDQLGPRASGFIINLRGDAELLLVNENAEHLGIIGGRYIDEIPNAELFFDDPLRNLNSSGPNNNYYYFFNNTDLVATIYGKAAGAFAIEKMTGDKIIHVFNVPIEENVTDSIFLSKEGDFSITFDSKSERDGKYGISVVTDSDIGTQYQGADNLSVIPGASFTYQIDWAALRAGENGDES